MILPGQKETYYASRPLTINKYLENIKNSRYGNGDELFLHFKNIICKLINI